MLASGALGKKVLFLYPPPVLTEIVEELARKEFEVFLVRDHAKARRFLSTTPDSIVFINLDDGLSEEEWERWVRELRSNEATSSVGIGVLSLNDDADLKQKYLMDIQVACGFITLKIGAAKTTEILAKTLEANEARGRRKFVRAFCTPGSAQFTSNVGDETLRGDVLDFSVAGLALNFENAHDIRPGSRLPGLQLAVKGGRVIADGIVVAHRGAKVGAEAPAPGDAGSTASSVIMFDPNSLDDNKREKLRSLVFKVNQANLDKTFEAL